MSKKPPLKVIAGTPERPLVIGDIEIQCYVLEDETRVLSQGGFLTAIGRSRTPKAGTGGMSNVDELPFFLRAEQLKPFVSNELSTSTLPIFFRLTSGQRTIGYNALLLPQVCEVYLRARDAGALLASQQHIAERAEVLIRGLATVGIIALVDEATGYQEIRENQALQKILNKFLTNEARRWSKTFPDEFWHKLIKVKGYPNYIALKRPQFVGHWVNDIVYSRLAPGIVSKLKEINPRTTKGDRRHKHHQHLTIDHGIPELREHLIRVMVLMDAASNSREFDRLLNTSLPKYGETLNLPNQRSWHPVEIKRRKIGNSEKLY